MRGASAATWHSSATVIDAACANRAERLHVHHRTYDNIFRETLDDLTTLCEDCHEAHHKWGPDALETFGRLAHKEGWLAGVKQGHEQGIKAAAAALQNLIMPPIEAVEEDAISAAIIKLERAHGVDRTEQPMGVSDTRGVPRAPASA